MRANKPKQDRKPDQHRAFKKVARELECDESERAFDKALGKIAKAKPAPKIAGK